MIFNLLYTNIKSYLKSLRYQRLNSIVLLGSWFGTKFADNTRFLFQFLHENKDKLGLKSVVWVSNDKELCNRLCSMGYEAYEMESEKSIYYHKIAGIHIICNGQTDILGQYSYGAKRINLWHGTGGFKGVDRESNNYRIYRNKHKIKAYCKEFLAKHLKLYRLFFMRIGGWGECFWLTTSDAQTVRHRAKLGLPDYLYVKSGYPRNCPCCRLLPEEKELIDKFNAYDMAVLYLPTFRADYNFDFGDISEQIEEILIKHNILWIEKPHTADTTNQWDSSAKENIVRLSSNFDINVLIPHITLLVTDYSSARTDAMYHNKPVLYFVPDLEEYKSGERGLVLDIDEEMCGPKIFSIEQLKEALVRYKDKPDEAKTPNYCKIREKYWVDGKDMMAIWNDIRGQVGF